MQICYVALELRSPFHNQLFAYYDEQHLMQLGERVCVPFGRKQVDGYVMKISDTIETDYELKNIIAKSEQTFRLSEEMIAIITWLVESKFAYYVDAINLFLSPYGKLKQTGNLQVKEKQYIIAIAQDATLSKNAKKQHYIYEALLKEELPLDLDQAKKVYSWEILKKFIDKGYIELGEKAQGDMIVQKPQIELTKEQQEILKQLKQEDEYAIHLIQGATGSGKTEIYLHYIEYLISQDKQVIVLVPEIALTHQSRQLFESRFGCEHTVWLHSQLTQKERSQAWEQIENEKAKIIIGTRTAIFAPVQNLGAIIVDEEHDAAYKQESQPVYHAREIAMIRANLHHVPLVFLSATPSVETYAQAMVGKYQHHILNQQATGQKHADVILVDMKNDDVRLEGGMISRALKEAIEKCCANKEQVILLLNKRGYSQSVQCRSCGQTEVCPTCGVPLVLHKHPDTLQCHYCNYKIRDHGKCTQCHSALRVDVQQGIQKLEEELAIKVPAARILRLDRDVAKYKGNTETVITAFQNQEADILIGTQMIAKGFDFPNVTLAAVINADTGLNIPHFRARERQYQLLKQLIGRAGRHKEGLAMIQTYQSDQPFFEHLTSTEQSFYKEELGLRKMYGYPPYKKQLLISVFGKSNDQLARCLRFIELAIRKQVKECDVLGPTRGFLNEMNGNNYGHITVKYTKKVHLNQIKEIIAEAYTKKYNTQIVLNVDPYQVN
ncbi:MAG: replication restart helicase PriA [Culicoidibacterales bacterium]